MNWLYYLAEANIYLGVFYLAYRLLLVNETYYQLTRAYLLFACMVSFVLPVLQLGILKPVEAVDAAEAYTLPASAYEFPVAQHVQHAPVIQSQPLTIDDYLIYAYAIGATLLFLMLMIKLFGLYRLMRNARHIAQADHKLVYLPDTNVAFSFFNYMFIGTHADGANTIIRHELVHIRQRHSADIIFLEVLKIINWFNPFIYLIQNSLKTVHEYIADEQTAAFETDTLTYSSFLVNNAYGAGGSSITHSFFNYNLLKKRIIMLNQKRSGSLARLKYLVAVPVCAGLLCTSTLAFSKTYGFIDLDPAKAVVTEANNITTPVTAVNDDPIRVPKTKPINFPPPMVIDNGFKQMSAFLTKTVHYDNVVSNTQGALIVVAFDVTANHTIANPRITRSSGTRFDAIALRGVKAYKGTVNAKPGERDFVFDFMGGNEDGKTRYNIINGNMDNRAGYIPVFRPARKPKLVVVDGKIVHPKADEAISADSMTYVPQLTKWAVDKWGDEARDGVYVYTGHGAVVKKSQMPLKHKDKNAGNVHPGRLHNAQVPADPNISFVVNGKRYDFTPEQVKNKVLVSITCDSMTIYEKGNAYAQSKWGKSAGKLAVLHGKTAAIKVGTFDELAGKAPKKDLTGKVTVAEVKPVADTTQTIDQQEFLRDMGRNVKYAAADRQNHIQGRVIATFSVDDDHQIQYVKIVRSPSNLMSNEVIRSLKINQYLGILKPGVQYIIPVSFTLGLQDGAPDEVVTPGPVTKGDLLTYNPKSVNIPGPNTESRMLNETVIRGYIKSDN